MNPECPGDKIFSAHIDRFAEGVYSWQVRLGDEPQSGTETTMGGALNKCMDWYLHWFRGVPLPKENACGGQDEE